jgi:hypothetical protein
LSKLDVGVGEEFPTEEAKRVEHHHHYYHTPRCRGRLLRIILAVVLISALVRGLNFAFNPVGWGPHAYWSNPFFPFGGLMAVVLVAGIALWLSRSREHD